MIQVFAFIGPLVTVAGVAFVYAFDGVLHGLVYWYQLQIDSLNRFLEKHGFEPELLPPALRWWGQNIHRVGTRMAIGLYAAGIGGTGAIFSFCFGWLGWIAAALFVHAGTRLGANQRQAFINAATGVPEPGKTEIVEGFWLPKLFAGEARYWKLIQAAVMLAIGIALLVLPQFDGGLVDGSLF